MKKIYYIVAVLFLTIFIYGCRGNIETPNSFTITFITNCDSQIAPLKVERGNKVPIPDISNNGYSLEGWYLSLNNGQTYDEKWIFTENTVYGDVTLYAKWSINHYNIVFNTNEGEAINNIVLVYNSPIILPEDPEKSGYIFDGWYMDQELTNEFDISKMPDRDLTLYAKWEPLTFTLNYVTGINQTIDSIQIKAGDLIPLPNDLFFEGRTFIGWVYSNGDVVTANVSTMPGKDTTIYAKWSFDTGYKIVVHYYRFDNDYTNWNLWLWPSEPELGTGSSYLFSGTDNYGVYAEISSNALEILGSPYTFGFIIRKGNWEAKDLDSDRFLSMANAGTSNVLDVYLVEGVNDVFYSLSSAQTAISNQVK